MIRRLGGYESLVWLSDKIESQNFCLYLTIEENIEIESFYRALLFISNQHEALKVCIDCGNFLFTNIQIEVVHYKMINDLDGVIQEELSKPFSSRLWRSVLINHTNKLSTIILTFHHVIADARSAFHFLADVLMQVKSDKKTSCYTLATPVEDYFNITYNLDHEYFSKNHNIQRQTVKQSCYSFQIPIKQVNVVKKLCAKNDFSLHALLCVTFAKALNCEINQNKIYCLSPIDVRSFFQDIEDKHFGYYLSRFDSIFDFSNTNDIIESAKIFYKEYRYNLRAKAEEHVASLAIAIDVLQEAGIEALRLLQTKVPTILVSNLGKLPETYDYFPVKDYGFRVNCNALLPNPSSALLTIATGKENMSLNLHFPKKFSYISERVFFNFKNILLSLT